MEFLPKELCSDKSYNDSALSLLEAIDTIEKSQDRYSQRQVTKQSGKSFWTKLLNPFRIGKD
jgi:hypothetical protein